MSWYSEWGRWRAEPPKCPICGKKAVLACKCPAGHYGCLNKHTWKVER